MGEPGSVGPIPRPSKSSHACLTQSKQNSHGHDIHATAPVAVWELYNKYLKIDGSAIDNDLEVVDFTRGLSDTQKAKITPVGTVSSETITAATMAFRRCGQVVEGESDGVVDAPKSCTIYEHKEFNGRCIPHVTLSDLIKILGLRLLPSFLPPECQAILLDRLFHRDLSNPLHKTNMHQDYDIPFPPASGEGDLSRLSFFSYPPESKVHVFTPLNPHSNHKPLNTSQFLRKKLRWLTIGSQYNWNTREYPVTSPTPFPDDIATLVKSLFNNSFTPESGVVLVYSPKDYMPVHRDVSEECERGLASFSLGCDGLFMIARDKYLGEDQEDENREQDIVVIRVRSGDVIQMADESRWAWHAMPKVIARTCPSWLAQWPVGNATPEDYEKWKGYMTGKRLNISCRQVWR